MYVANSDACVTFTQTVGHSKGRSDSPFIYLD